MGTKFYRPARSYPSVLPINDVIISAPPVVQPTQTGVTSWLQYLLPAVGGFGSLIFVFAYRQNLLVMIAGVTIAFGSVGGGLAMGIVQRFSQKKQRTQQRKRYLDYLKQYQTHLEVLAERQHEVNKRLYPDYKDLPTLLEQRTSLWERRPADTDFLTVSLGTVPAPLCRVSLDLSTDIMVQYVPEMRSQAEALVDKWRTLHDMPALISLRSIGVLAINGKLADTRALARALLCQVVAFQSPEDVRCMVCFPEESIPAWSWLKWLPHARRLRQIKAEKQHAPDHLCLLAHSIEDVNNLLIIQIKPELDRRRRLSEDKQQNAQSQTTLPHLFIILDTFSPFNKLGQLPELDTLLRDAAKFGITVICLVDDRSQEPAQIEARLSVSSIKLFGYKEIRVDYEEMKLGGQRAEWVTPDSIDPRMCERMARSMAPLSLVEAGTQQDLSQDVRLLKLLNLPAADAFETAETWRPRPRPALLNVPIGMRADGNPLMIDFKEAADKGMGPHGLVIGATGSGKSELLRTIVVSLAITHDPHMVNFVLIDFKGGASFADFGALPHVAGIITNLEGDLSLVDRVYYSLLGEQQRRQRLLRDAGNLDNIKQYQAKWQMNPDLEPMPHLLIIADEFAELIVNRPDFLELFITMGRVGRSLGLHLLFATQRLDEGRIRGLEGHLRYRICLRTFSVAESTSVLGKPDAYYLPSSPGVGYFKVDTDTYHLFKTALISVPYVPEREQVSPRARIREFTSTGKLVKYRRQTSGILSLPSKPLEAEEPSDLHTEMDVVIERLAHTSRPQAHHPVHQVWLPPLPKQLPLSTVLQKCRSQELNGQRWSKQSPFGTLHVPLGLLDMPQQQAQEPFILDFSGTGGHLALVGAPQSGKSTFLRMLVASLMLTHSPQDVQIYGIDLGGGLLRVFEQAPHVGAVCSKADRDKLRRMVRKVRKVIEDREYLFREQRIDSMTTFRTRRQAGEFADFPFGDVFLIIDNFAQFVQEFDMEAEIAELIASGLTYGVHVVIAANRWMEIRSKLRDNIGTRLELRLNDPVDSEFGKVFAAAVPLGVPGRGLTKDKLQFQVSLPIIDASSAKELPSVQQALEDFIQRARQHWHGPTAPPVLMLPPLVRWDDFPSAKTPDQPSGVPLGLEEFRLEPIFLDLITEGPHFLILGDSECGKTTLLRAWMRGIEQRYDKQEASFAIIDYRKTLVDFAESKHLLTYAYNATTLTPCVGNFKADLEKRMATDGDVPLSRMRTSKRWTGRHYFLFVDDYDSLVQGTSTPLGPLVEYLTAGRDIGFHVVIARRVGGIGRSAFEPVLQRLREMGTSAIIMSGDPQEGRIMHNQAAMLQPPGRGYLVRRNHPSTLVQIAFAEPAYTVE
jgi:S-DNA-T family DNA segregation ATPase FtsK/SpoIIIE